MDGNAMAAMDTARAEYTEEQATLSLLNNFKNTFEPTKDIMLLLSSLVGKMGDEATQLLPALIISLIFEIKDLKKQMQYLQLQNSNYHARLKEDEWNTVKDHLQWKTNSEYDPTRSDYHQNIGVELQKLYEELLAEDGRKQT